MTRRDRQEIQAEIGAIKLDIRALRQDQIEAKDIQARTDAAQARRIDALRKAAERLTRRIEEQYAIPPEPVPTPTPSFSAPIIEGPPPPP
jgi:hypothetical protein